jgi:hypothetical protein
MTAAGVALAVIAGLMFLQETTRLVPAEAAHYSLSADGRQLVVTFVLSRLESIESQSAQESASAVKVIVLVSRRSGTATLDARLIDVRFALTSPLDGRAVIDARGSPVPPKVSAP